MVEINITERLISSVGFTSQVQFILTAARKSKSLFKMAALRELE